MEQSVVDALRALENRRGEITAEVVLAAAKSSRSPLHQLFEWDDSKAAEQFRLKQARDVINDYKIVIHVSNTTRRVKSWVHNPQSEGGGYVSVATLRKQNNTGRNAKLLLENSKQMAGSLENLFEVAVILSVCVEEFSAARDAVQLLMAALEAQVPKADAA